MTLPFPIEHIRSKRPALRAFAAFCVFLVAACSGDNRPPIIDLGGSGPGSEGPCVDGTEKPCGVTLDQANGVVSCYHGTQYCVDGAWSECTDGEFTQEPDTKAATLSQPFKLESLSAAAKCTDNPCDPSCMYFNENPPDITPPAGTGTTIDPGLPDWSTPGGFATCGHELCTTGAALNASCHPCVQNVCATNPSCCSSGWSSACVNLVYTACSGTAPPAGLNLCDFAAFAQSSIRFGNGGTGSPMIGAGAVGTINTPDGSAVYLETGCRTGNIYTQGGLNLRNGCQVNGNVIAKGNVYAEAGATKVIGSVAAGGWLEMRNNVDISGPIQVTGDVLMQSNSVAQSSVWAGGVLNFKGPGTVNGHAQSVGSMLGNSGTILGTATVKAPSTISNSLTVIGARNPNGAVTVPPIPTVTLPNLDDYRRNISTSCTVANSRPNYNVWGPDLTLPPGIYGDVIVYSGYKLTLQVGGTYVFKSLRFYAGSMGLHLGGSPGWDVSVCNTFQTDLGIPVYLSGTTTRPNPKDLLVYSAATSGDCISIGDNNVFAGMFLAPDCQIRIYNNYTGSSAFWGKTVYTDTGMNLTPIPTSSCQSANLLGNANCDGTAPLYANGATYVPGNTVHFNGTKYTCLVGASCSSAGGYGDVYWPGRGASWSSAWSSAGACPGQSGPSTGGSCPISLSLPATKPPRASCYSGQDCQINSRCTEVITNPSCSHSKCTTGAALNSTCDSCVTRICADTPSCCTSSWTAACAAKVATVCDASCGTVTSPGCAHDMCATGTALNAACSPQVADVCAAMPSCCSSSWTNACITKLGEIVNGTSSSPAPGTSRCDYAVMGATGVTMHANRVIGGDTRGGPAANSIQTDWGIRPNLSGNVYSQGSMVLNSADVGGKAQSTGTMNCSGCTVGSGVATGGTAVPAATIPTKTFTCPTGGSTQNFNGNVTLAPGSYAAVSQNTWGATLTLQAGTYNVASLTIANGARLQLPATGTVIINSCGNVYLGDQSQTLGATSGADALRLQIYSASTATSSSSCSGNAICVGASAVAYATLTAPNGGGYLSQGATVYGFVQTGQGYFRHSSIVNATGVVGSACVAAGLNANSSWTCNVTTPLSDKVAEGGMCVANGTNYKAPISQCANVDLAVDINCVDNTIPVCNHGNTDVPANQAELAFYRREGQQFANSSPNASWNSGLCTITTAIPAGTCINQACSAANFPKDMTVEVRLRSGATVTECSALDNWTYYVKNRACTTSSTAGSETKTYTYEAICPVDSDPSWGFLTWKSSAPGAARIDFSARVAATAAGLATASYTTLGSSRSSPSDTQTCSTLGPFAAGCPIDLTKALFGTNRNVLQPKHLELRAHLQGSGTDAPTLEDWKITYSCLYKQ